MEKHRMHYTNIKPNGCYAFEEWEKKPNNSSDKNKKKIVERNSLSISLDMLSIWICYRFMQ